MTTDRQSFDRDIRALIARGEDERAFLLLAKAARCQDDFVTQRRNAQLMKSIDRAQLGLRKVRLVIVSTSTVEHLVEILNLWFPLNGLDPEIYVAAYDTVVQTVLDFTGALYAFRPDFVWFFTGWRDVKLAVDLGDSQERVDAAVGAAADAVAALWEKLRERFAGHVVHNNVDVPAVDVFGNFEASVPWSGRSLMRRYNIALAERLRPGISLFDLDHISATFGKSRWDDPRYWFHSKHAFSLDGIGPVAFDFTRLIAAAKGSAKKCLVLDLDNTLWGGVIGDDGLEGIRLGSTAEGEAFAAFQSYLQALRQRGVILAVCSKNDEGIARQPFEQHPDMRLRLDDIALFRVNWDNKPDNIRHIARALNIGLESMVFFDDNPVERDYVSRCLPMLTVVPVPEDPSRFVSALQEGRYFEAVSFSREDVERTDYYRDNVSRDELLAQFSDLAEFQKSLQMVAEFNGIDAFYLPRAAQLINKSNQFNLTGKRYSESEIGALLSKGDRVGRYFILRDRFGSNGLISVVLLEREGDQLNIDTWVMSCRVLGRGMEEFIINTVSAIGHSMGCGSLVGRYVPSGKNRIVEDLYRRLGFEPMGQNENDAPTTKIWRKWVAAAPLTTQVAAAEDCVRL